MSNYLDTLKLLKESEDHVEFKAARHNYPFAGGSHSDPRDRRRCVLGYVVALANEQGGRLVLGMEDKSPHNVCGSDFAQGEVGNLEAAIYKNLGIRVNAIEEYEQQKRVLVIDVPSRPIGRLLKFEGVALMRVGEELHEMSDAQMLKILSEQEPDFSAKTCEGLAISDLDEEAIRILKVKYGEKMKNPSFKNLPTEQVLSDLELLQDGRLNYAALMLLGRPEVIHRILPQYEIIVEYRKDKSAIQYNARKEFVLPLFVGIYKVWDYLNQPFSNPEDHLRIGLDIQDINAFNEESIREGILNSLAHRSMQLLSSVVIKQSPDQLTIINPGGFPLGVNMNNILTVSSNPRQKRVAEVLEKTGLVERSGQGVDKMFANCIRDGKVLPSFEGTDDYQVSLTFFAKLEYPELASLIRQEQIRRNEDNELNIFQLIGLYHIERGEADKVSEFDLASLAKEELIKQKRGKWIINYKSVANVANELSEKQNIILNSMVSGEQYTTQSLSRMTGIGLRTLQRELSVLEKIGKVQRVGNGKNIKWISV